MLHRGRWRCADLGAEPEGDCHKREYDQGEETAHGEVLEEKAELYRGRAAVHGTWVPLLTSSQPLQHGQVSHLKASASKGSEHAGSNQCPEFPHHHFADGAEFLRELSL